MARPLRIEFEGAWYHVMNRGAGGRRIFGCADNRLHFISLLEILHETFGVETHAYCLLDNHYHLVIHTPRGNLSRAMRHLNGVYTQRFNRREGTDGPLFRGRYKAILVDADNYLAQLSRYVHLNPVRAGIVGRPTDYAWSSYRCYAGLDKPPSWLHLHPTLDLIAKRNQSQRYQDFVEEGVDEEISSFFSKKRLEPILGNESFRQGIQNRRELEPDQQEIPDQKRIVSSPSIETVVTETAAHFDIPTETVFQKVRGRGQRNLPRMIAIALSRDLGGYSLREIAAAFDIGHYATVSVTARRLKEWQGVDFQLDRMVKAIRTKLQGQNS